jgi:hypothetical protein
MQMWTATRICEKYDIALASIRNRVRYGLLPAGTPVQDGTVGRPELAWPAETVKRCFRRHPYRARPHKRGN